MIKRFIKSKKDVNLFAKRDNNLIRDMLSLVGIYNCILSGKVSLESWEEYFNDNKNGYALFNKGKKEIKKIIIEKNNYTTLSEKMLVSNSVFIKLCETHRFRCVFLPQNADAIFETIIAYIHDDNHNDGRVNLKEMLYSKLLSDNCHAYTEQVTTNGLDCLNWILKFHSTFISLVLGTGSEYSETAKKSVGDIKKNMKETMTEYNMYNLCRNNRR